MKRILLILIALNLGFAKGQTSMTSYDEVNPRWFFGSNIGATWQTSDVKAYPGMAFGFTFGNYIYKKPGRALNVAWRFRYLHGVMFGMGEQRSYGLQNNTTLNGSVNANLNYRDSLGYVFPNYRMEINRYSIELMIGFNRLRERTNIVLNLFGGVGLTQHWNWTDQLDANGNRYDYSQLDSTGTTLADLNRLRGVSSFRQLDYESNSDTYVGSTTTFMPSLGIELGYQFGKWFTMGVGHKVTFALNDNIDGYRFNNDNTNQGKNDIYHYSHVFFRWYLGRGKHTRDDNNNTTNTNTTNTNTTTTNTNTNTNTNTTTTNNPPVASNRPVIHFTNPASCPTNVQAPGYVVKANIYYVNNANQVVFKVNGDIVSGFTYLPSTQEFISPVLTLLPGDNIIELKATNEVGSDYKSCVINYQTTINNYNNQLPPPVITVTNPPSNPYTTNSANINITATILNITSASQINYTVNGITNTGFFFNPSNGAFSSSIMLNEGYNTIDIIATNTAGQDREILTINYVKPVTGGQPPVVTIYNPNVDPYTVATNSTMVSATVLNVPSSANIQVTVNGASYAGFSFNASTQQLNMTPYLSPGANVVQISATNAFGNGMDHTTIIYKEPEVNLPPIVTFVDPNINPYTSATATKFVKAVVQHVTSSSQVAVKLNGSPVTGFAFVSTTGEVSFTANLIAGANVVEVKGTNPYGSDNKSTIIIFKKETPTTTLPPPVVVINYPMSNPYNTSVASETVTATVLNVGGMSDIAVTVNGAITNSFTYNNTSHLATIPVSLVIGSNIVSVTGTNPYGSDSKTTTIIYNPPCDKPVIQNINPVANTLTVTAATMNFAAHVLNISNSSQVSLMVNGTNYPFTYDAVTGTVNANLNFNNGVNNIILTATNNCGNASVTYAITYQKPLLPPVVTFIQPAVNPASVSIAPYTINASITNVPTAAGISYKINGVVNTGFTYNGATGSFTSNVTLVPGTNIFEITGTNTDGTDSKSTVIVYTEVAPPCNTPVIALNNPPGTTFNTTAPLLNLLATVTNCTAAQVVVKHNGSVVSHTLTGTSLTANINLVEGPQTVVIEANNGCAQTSQAVTINYKRIPEPPVVTITNPGSNPYNSASANVTIQAKIYKVSTAANVTFKVNGVSGTAFTYNPATNDFSASYVLTAATTTFQVTGTNADGTDSKTVVINYVQASSGCIKPLITWTSPPSGGSTSVASFSLGASVVGVASQTNISLQLNGLTVPFAYAGSTKKLASTVTLQPGVNVFTVTANNDCGSVTETYEITYNRPKQPPVITITKPAVNPYLTTTPNNTVEANITNISVVSGVSCTVNGVTNTSFTFVPATGKFTLPLVLTPGIHTITINAVNTDGSDTKSTVIEYKIINDACLSPTVTPPAISAAGKITSGVLQTYTATVTRVSNPSQVTVTHNGTPVVFTLTGSTVKFEVTLTPGVNTFVIKGTNECGSDEKSFAVTYIAPIKPPVVNITKPVTAGTNVVSPAYTLEASLQNVSNAAQISMTFNGVIFTGFTYNVGTGVLTAPLTLVTGNNTVVVSANTPDGSDSDNTNIILTVVAPPCKAPVITIPATLNNSVVSSPSQIITASVANVTSPSQVTLKQGTTNIPFTLSGGNISATVTLVPGKNQFALHAENECGKADQIITIDYKALQPPVVDITLPATSGTTVTVASYNLQAALQYVTSASQVSMTFNGASFSSFTYDPTTGKLNAPLVLVSGTNTVVVSASTPGGTASDNTTIIYATASTNCKSPEITFAAAQGSVVSTLSYTFQATVTNVTSAQVTVKHNSTVVPFTLTGSNLSATVKLAPGKNMFTVNAMNDCGKVEQILVINYFPPLVPPVVTITNPATSGTTVTNATYNFKATVLNVSNASQISMTFNGTPFTSFTYNMTTHVLNATLTLNTGANNVTVSASTPDGSDSESTLINYTAPCPAPVITVPLVIVSGVNVTSPAYTLSVNVVNVIPAQVTVQLNGANVPASLSGTVLTVPLTLPAGNNTVDIYATNNCGSDHKAIPINYCSAPTITFPGSSGGSIVAGAPSYNLNALVTNVTPSQVTFQVNGANHPFTLSGSNLSANLNLNTGDNVVTINANNTCGSTKGSVIIKYNPAPTMAPPVITITNPAGGSATVTNPNFIMSGTVSNISSAGNLEVKVNGANVTSFIYTASTKMLSVPAVLVSGNNTIQVKASNAAGTDIKTVAINFDDPSLKALITICHSGQTMNIPMSQWSTHQAHGDVMGACPTKTQDKIEIKVPPTLPTKTTDNNNNQQQQQKESANEQDYNNAMQRGNQALANKNYTAAKAEFQKALTYKPNDTTAKNKITEADNAAKAASSPKLTPEKVEGGDKQIQNPKGGLNKVIPSKGTVSPNP